MYDAHYILNIIRSFTKNRLVRKFIKDLFPASYLKNKSDVVLDSRLRPMKHEGLPTYEDILNHPFLKPGILRKIVPKKTVATPKPKPAEPKVKTASAIRRAKAVLEREAAKKARPPKRPGIAVARANTGAPKPKIFVNKNGDLKIDRRKCRLYK